MRSLSLLLALAVFGLFACASTPDDDTWRKLRLGMSKDGVESVLGAPEHVIDHGDHGVAWHYACRRRESGAAPEDLRTRHCSGAWIVRFDREGRMIHAQRPTAAP